MSITKVSVAFIAVLSFVSSVFAQSLPDDMTLTITKTGKENAAIKITRGTESWETKEGNWSNVPEEAKAYLKSVFPRNLSLNVEIDCSDSPESKEWAEKSAATAKEWYPKLVELLDSDNFQPAGSVKLVFKKMDGVAYASRGTITISADWIKQHPEDLGMVVHELIHVVQAYRGRNSGPGWVVEGMADYIRFFLYEPGKVGVRVNPERNKYTDSYRITACFFDWIVTTKDKQFITKMNAVCRAGKYSEDTFKELTGATVDELWTEYTDTLKKKD